MEMMNMSRHPRRAQAGYGLASAFVLGLAMTVTGVGIPGGLDGTLSAQAQNPCALLTKDDVEGFANASIDGVASSFPSFSSEACRYTWGAGINRFVLGVIVLDASRGFAGMTPDQIKQRLVGSIKAGTDEEVIPDVGEAAVFRTDSPYYATATALLKGHILEVQLDGLVARDKKDEAIKLLKSAASRL
jgi:hypothetical protein